MSVDYSGDLVSAIRRRHPKGVDAALHAPGDGLVLADLVTPGGRMSSALGIGQDQVGGRDLKASAVMAIPNTAILTELAEAVASGHLRAPLSRSYPLDQVSNGIQDFAWGAVGKIGVTVE